MIIACLKQQLSRVYQRMCGIKNLQVSFKGNAEIALHTKAEPQAPKAKAELVEDGMTVDLTDLLLVGAVLAAAGSVISLIRDIFE